MKRNGGGIILVIAKRDMMGSRGLQEKENQKFRSNLFFYHLSLSPRSRMLDFQRPRIGLLESNSSLETECQNPLIPPLSVKVVSDLPVQVGKVSLSKNCPVRFQKLHQLQYQGQAGYSVTKYFFFHRWLDANSSMSLLVPIHHAFFTVIHNLSLYRKVSLAHFP